MSTFPIITTPGYWPLMSRTNWEVNENVGFNVVGGTIGLGFLYYWIPELGIAHAPWTLKYSERGNVKSNLNPWIKSMLPVTARIEFKTWSKPGTFRVGLLWTGA